MRKLLAAAAALAPLMVASGAAAEVVISTARTTPILTSNATGSAADNIRLASGGSIAVTSGAAVTVDSSHSIDLDSGSSITMTNTASGSAGILVNGGNTANVTVGGTITLTDGVTEATDTDKDGDADGPFATGSNRYGVRLAGPGAVTGTVLVETGGSISVKGNDSYGISLESALNGNVTVMGGVSVIGDNTYAVRNTGTVSGNVLITGASISAMGANAVGVAIDGAVAGRLQIQGAVSTTGYRYTSPPPSGAGFTNLPSETLTLEDLDADDLLQGGPAVRVGANVAGGVLLGIAPTYRLGVDGDDDGDGVKNGDEDDDGDGIKNSADTDRDGDGILDANEGNSALTSFGGAPALLVGSATNSITLGAVGTGDLAYGLVNQGTIGTAGLYANVSTVGVQLGAGGGQTTTIAGGMNNSGSITAQSLTASATAINIGAGVRLPTLLNSGSITGQVVSENADTAIGVQIAAGANVTSINNRGKLAAAIAGEKASAYAVRDLSGTLTSVTNSGLLSATITPTNATTADITGAAVALDLRANTTGVNFVQFGEVGRTPSGSGSDSDKDGVYDIDEPLVVGSMLLGSGADTVDIRNGQVLGDISFGAGADRLAISGGAVYRGALSDSDGQLAIDVTNGTLDARQTTALNVSSLNVGANGDLIVTVDPKNNTVGGFNVSGTANIATGAGLGVNFASLVQGTQRFNVIHAGTLNVGAIDASSIAANSPYLFVTTVGADVAAGNVYVDARQRTAAEAQLKGVEISAYDAFYGALGASSAVQTAFLAQATRDGFIGLYEQLLPDHSGGPLLSLASGVDAVTRALTGRNATAGPGETSAWVQEINFYADKDRTDTYGFKSEGFGVAGGVERGTGLGAFGVSLAFTSSDIKDPEAKAEEVLSASLTELGLYWRAQGQAWTTWARAAGGYASFDSKRALVGNGIFLNNQATWNGLTLALAGGASYERKFGRLNIRPEVYAEYFGLREDAHTESGGGAGFDLDIDERTGHVFSSVAAVNIGYGFGANGWIRPELRVGWRQNISVDGGDTIGRFTSGGPDFKLTPASIEGGGPIAGFRLSVGNELGMLSINADAEMLEDYVRYTLLLRASFKF